MRRVFTLIALTALAFGCIEDNEELGVAELELTFVSGHLGSYHDCPDRSMRLSSPAVAEAPADRAAGAAFADCDSDDCGGPLNCMGAELTIRLTNDGDAAIDGLSVTALQLLSMAEATLGSPEIERVTVAGEVFDGELGLGETVDLRIEFTGPHPNDLGWDEGALIEVHIGDGAADSQLTSPEVQSLPAFAT